MRIITDKKILFGLGGATVLLIVGLAVFLRVSTPAAAAIGGPFTLQDIHGRTVTDRDFRGSWLLVYFGYSYCPDVCPTTLNDVSTALDQLGDRARDLRPIFITIDPRRDTPQALATYLAAFSPRLDGLTGTPEQIAAVAKEYRVYYAEHRTGPGPDDYTMDHSSVLYLVGPDGRFRSVIRADTSPDQIAADIAKRLP